MIGKVVYYGYIRSHKGNYVGSYKKRMTEEFIKNMNEDDTTDDEIDMVDEEEEDEDEKDT